MKSIPSILAAKRMFAVITVLAMLACAFALPADAATTGYAAEVARLVNEERANDKRLALSAGNSALNAAAQKRAEEVAAKFDHQRPNGKSCFSVLGEYDISFAAAGENIAKGQYTPGAAMAAWMGSAPHRQNILGLKVNFNCIGVGVYEMEDGTVCWVQLFINDGTAPTAPSAGQIGGSTNIFARIWSWILSVWNAITGFFSKIFSF